MVNRQLPSVVAWLVLALIACAMAYAVLVGGTPIAQSHGDNRQQQITSIAVFGSLGLIYGVYACFTRVAERSLTNCGFAWFIFLLPAYAVLQVIPLPLSLVRILSPMRAHLADAVGTVLHEPPWVPLSVAPSATAYHCLLLGVCAIVFWLVYETMAQWPHHPWIIVLPLVLIGIFEAILGLLQVADSSGGVAVGTYAIRNHYAGLLEIVLPFPAVYALSAFETRGLRQPERASCILLASFSAVSAAFIFAAIIASQSRMGFVTSSASIVLIALLKLARLRSRKRAIFAVLTLVLVSLAVMPSAHLVLRFAETKDFDRIQVWRETLSLIKAYPIFGCGLGGFESAFFLFKKSQPMLDQDYAHNDYLQYLSELGALGFVLALAPCVAVLVTLWKLLRGPFHECQWLGAACTAAIVAIGLHSFVDFNLYVPANLFLFAWLLAVGTYTGSLEFKNRSKPATVKHS